MTTNKPEIVAYMSHEFGEVVSQQEYAGWEHDAFRNPGTDYGNYLRDKTLKYSEPLICLSDYQRLQAEYEELRKDAKRSGAAFCAVIEYMLGDGRHEDPLEFLGYWVEGDFDLVKDGWPEAPAAIYYADAMDDHDAIDAAIAGDNPC